MKEIRLEFTAKGQDELDHGAACEAVFLGMGAMLLICVVARPRRLIQSNTGD